MISFCFGNLCIEVKIVYEIIAVLIAFFGVLAVIGNGRKDKRHISWERDEEWMNLKNE